VRWLKVYYGDRSMKVVSADLGEAESLVALWWHGGRPSRQKLQKLAEKFERESFSQFVFGFPTKGEIVALLRDAQSNMNVLADYIRAA
jgi:hypothetical protein